MSLIDSFTACLFSPKAGLQIYEKSFTILLVWVIILIHLINNH
jgi:hypothetical protein